MRRSSCSTPSTCVRRRPGRAGHARHHAAGEHVRNAGFHMRIRDHRKDDEPEINLVPLIDVILVLIIFFVVTATFDARSVLKLELPKATGEADQRLHARAERPGECRRPLFRRRSRSAARRRGIAQGHAGAKSPAATASARCCCAPTRARRTRRWSRRTTRWASSASGR